MEDNRMDQEQYNQNQEYQYQNPDQNVNPSQNVNQSQNVNPNQNVNQNPNQTQYQYAQERYSHQPKPFLPSYDVNAFSILALVMGVMAISSGTYLVGGILAIVFSQMAKKRVRLTDTLGRKFAKAGLVLGIISLALYGLSIVSGMWLVSGLFSDFWYYL